MMALLDLTVDLELAGPQQGWTDVTRDVLVRGGVSWDYGLPGPMPADRAAAIGECRYQLDNSAANSAGIAGYYAPGYAHARAGFDLGIGCRIGLARPWDALVAAATHRVGEAGDTGVRWAQAFSSFLSTDANHAQLIGTSNYATLPAFDRGDGVDRYLRVLTLQHDADGITVNLTDTTTGTGDPAVDLTDDAESHYGIAFRDRDTGTVWDFAFATDDADPYALPTTQATLDAIQAVIDGGSTLDVLLYDGRHVRQRKLYYLDSLDPSFGPAATRVTVCHGTDWMGIAARTSVSGLPLQQAQRTDQIIQTILNAMPVTPRTVVLEMGQSTLDYALDDLRGERATALDALYRVTLSELGYLTAEGDDDVDGETVRFVDRTYRAQRPAGHQIRRALTLVLQRSITEAVDLVRVGISLRRVDAGTTTVLYQLGDAAMAIPAGATIHPFGPYRDPAQEAQRVGGANLQTPVSGTDYVANTAADGSGTDVTTQLTVTASFGASGVRWTITNTGTVTAYLTTLQARGRGIYDYARAYLEAAPTSVSADQAHNILTLTLPYGSDLNVAQSVADDLLDVYGIPRTRVQSVTLMASRNAAMATLAVSARLHELCSVVDELAGVTTAHHVNRLAYRVASPGDVRVTIDLAHTDETDVWILGTSTLGETTRLGWG